MSSYSWSRTAIDPLSKRFTQTGRLLCGTYMNAKVSVLRFRGSLLTKVSTEQNRSFSARVAHEVRTMTDSFTRRRTMERPTLPAWRR